MGLGKQLSAYHRHRHHSLACLKSAVILGRSRLPSEWQLLPTALGDLEENERKKCFPPSPVAIHPFLWLLSGPESMVCEIWCWTTWFWPCSLCPLLPPALWSSTNSSVVPFAWGDGELAAHHQLFPALLGWLEVVFVGMGGGVRFHSFLLYIGWKLSMSQTCGNAVLLPLFSHPRAT